MPANRTAAIGSAGTAVVGALVTLLGAIHNDYARAIVVSVALLVVGAVAIVFLSGSQKHEARQARAAARMTHATVTSTVGQPDPRETSAALGRELDVRSADTLHPSLADEEVGPIPEYDQGDGEAAR